MKLMNRPAAASQTPAVPDPYAVITPPLPQVQANPPAASVPQPVTVDPQVSFNPYPASMRQSVIQPASAQPQQQSQSEPEQTTSNQPMSPDIINLANNSDLSIETLAHEAKRIREKEEKADGEVVISLR